MSRKYDTRRTCQDWSKGAIVASLYDKSSRTNRIQYSLCHYTWERKILPRRALDEDIALDKYWHKHRILYTNYRFLVFLSPLSKNSFFLTIKSRIRFPMAKTRNPKTVLHAAPTAPKLRTRKDNSAMLIAVPIILLMSVSLECPVP